MNSIEKDDNSGTLQKYLTLLNIICAIENRLTLSELAYTFLNIIVLFFIGTLIYFKDIAALFSGALSLMLCIVIGEFLCVFWVISSMRMQLKLKLHYFHARSLERKMNSPGEYLKTDEYAFYDSDIRRVESFDKKETAEYPSTGAVRMDGFAGSAKPRHLSWIMPALFFMIYCVFFIQVLLRLFSTQ